MLAGADVDRATLSYTIAAASPPLPVQAKSSAKAKTSTKASTGKASASGNVKPVATKPMLAQTTLLFAKIPAKSPASALSTLP
jgi:hypothetical protein